MEVFRALFSIIGTFLTLSMSIAVLGSIFERLLNNHNIFEERFQVDWLWVGLGVAIFSVPWYYIPPPYDCILLDLIAGFH